MSEAGWSDEARRSMLRIYAPSGYAFSPWVKPVLFSFMQDEVMAVSSKRPTIPPEERLRILAPRVAPSQPAPGYREAAEDIDGFNRTAFVIEEDGVRAIEIGIGLLTCGARPIPIFTSCPEVSREPALPAAIDMGGVVRALAWGAKHVARHALPDDAPPAFLVDARRAGPLPATSSYFDNRSIVFPGDFPSGAALLAAGITRIVYVSPFGTRKPLGKVPIDLRAVLGGWQRAGLPLYASGFRTADSEPTPLDVRGLRLWDELRFFWHSLGMTPRSDGGFGAAVRFTSG